MKKLFFLLLLPLFFVLGQEDNSFTTQIDTDQKPWTHLKFYNDPQNFQFVIVSDRNGGNRKGVFATAVDKINLLMPEFVMSVGDLIAGYTQDTTLIRQQWQEFNTILGHLKVPFFYLPGNHDITNKVMQEEWEKRYGKRYYYFIYKDVLFITLDSNDDDDHSITNQQKQFVLETLADHKDVRWTFLFMHHPIWKYDTENRFQEIEKALNNRKYTVFAGHEHKYHHSVRNDHNYYILATTGAGSSLHGPRFGRFDHIAWVTITDDGPVFANLELKGIHEHDVSNDETRELAESLLQNTRFENTILCNSGDQFKEGSLYLYLNNKADQNLKLLLNFYHHHQIDIAQPKLELILPANTDTTISIEFTAHHDIYYDDLDLLQFDWKMGYNDKVYTDFELEGKFDIPINPFIQGNYLKPDIYKFLESTQISINMPFKGLTPRYELGNKKPAIDSPILNDLELTQTSLLNVYVFNENNQYAEFKKLNFNKVKLQKSVKIKNSMTGLAYKYYTGEWMKLPDFGSLDPVGTGIAKHFWKTDLFWKDGIKQQEDNFGIVYTGYINIPFDGLYQFRINADDAARVFINNELVINDDLPHRNGNDLGISALEKGLHIIKIEFMEQKGNQRLRLYYRINQENKWELVPYNNYKYQE